MNSGNRPAHSRQPSDQERHKMQGVRSSPTVATRPADYTVVVRLPFPRGDFVDPPPVNWDSVKDKALWKIISKGETQDLDWEGIANRFDVSLAFLMKQAAWLYERHFAGMRKQMQRLATSTVPSSSTLNTVQESTGTYKVPPINTAASLLSRQGSKRTSSTSTPRPELSPISAGTSTSTRADAPGFSRTPSTTTITQSRLFTSDKAQRPSRTSGTTVRPPTSPRQQNLELSESLDGDSSMTAPEARPQSRLRASAKNDALLARSQAFRRPPLASKSTSGGLSSEGDIEDVDEDDEDESQSAGFLPFATTARQQDPGATLRGEPVEQTLVTNTTKQASLAEAINSSASSASSTHLPQSSESGSRHVLPGRKPGPLSPKHRAQLRQLSPRDGRSDVTSDDTPSMGSSFSDLDDAGISASAIEDAVLSNMQAGGGSIASRVSGLSQAFRSAKHG